MKIVPFKNTIHGSILIQVLAYMTIGTLILSGFVQWSILSIRTAQLSERRAQALAIAEAGVDYYRWHLAHSPTDFEDGTATSGPYVHNFENKNGVVVGTYTLEITPPPLGSTLVVIRSSGRLLSDPSVVRTIETKLAKPSLAKYAVVANADMRFGAGTEIFGPVHSNGGIHFDGFIHNIMTSAKSTYVDPDYGGAAQFGVYTRVAPQDPLPPAAVPSRTDVFQVGRQFPIPAYDFSGLLGDLAQMKSDAQTGGKYYAPSSGKGYYIRLNTNDTFDIYRVNALAPTVGGCTSGGQSDWGTWSINGFGSAKTAITLGVPLPSNGIIFVEDDLWVDGQINTARVTIAAGTFPDSATTRKSITVNNNLLYTNYDGRDVISLVAQNDINVGLQSANSLRIDAALVAEHGRIGRLYYNSSCTAYYYRNDITLYGMLATNERYGFMWSPPSGYPTRNIIYDANLLYGPPPSFPLTTDQYQILSWEEVK